MKLFKNLSAVNLIAPVLICCYLSFTLLSWVLLFRDKRALTGISHFYPNFSSFLFSSKEYLLHHGLNTIPTFLFALVAVIAIIFYLKSLTVKISLKKTIIFAIIFQSIVFLSYPILSTDIFSYIFSERIATVHHENIWKVKPAAFPNDDFSQLADWKDTTNVYGGLNYFLYEEPSVISQNNLLLQVTLYKLLPAIFGIASMYILYLLLRTEKVEWVTKGLRLVFWNPLFILEIFGSGHNDGIMIFLTLLSALLYKRKMWLLSGIVLALAVQIKLLPVVLCFFYIMDLIYKRAWINILSFLAGFMSITVLSFSLMQVNPLDFLSRVAYNGGVYWQSLPNLIRYLSPEATKLITIGFLIWLVSFIIRQWKKQQDPINSYVIVLLVYLLFVSAAYWNWYILWILPFLPFITDKKVFWTTLVFSFTSLLSYPLLWLSQRFGFGSFIWPIITYIFIFGIPITVYLCFLYQEKTATILLKRFALQEVFAEKAHH